LSSSKESNFTSSKIKKPELRDNCRRLRINLLISMKSSSRDSDEKGLSNEQFSKK
jgi:hypothetical protein